MSKSITIKGIPDDVMRRFRAFSSLYGKSMTDMVIQLMTEKAEKMKSLEDELKEE